MKPLLWPSEYLAELNNRLQAHPEFENGMRFVAHPPGIDPDRARGYSWEGPDGKSKAFVQVAQKLSNEFDIKMKP